METIDVIEFEPEAFTPLWLTQQTLKGCNAFPILQKQNPDLLQNVLQKPHVFVIRHPRQIDMDFIQNTIIKGKEKGKPIFLKHNSSLCKPMGWPFAVVVFLDTTAKHGDCHLSQNDLRLLEWYGDRLAELEDVVYVIKKTRSSGKYNADDLDVLSQEIQTKLHGSIRRNMTFSNIFLHEDKQIPVRIGHCLQSSTVYCFNKIIRKIRDMITTLGNEHLLLEKNRTRFVRSVSEGFLKIESINYDDVKIIPLVNRPDDIGLLSNNATSSCYKSLTSLHLKSLRDIISRKIVVKRFQDGFFLEHFEEENVKEHEDLYFTLKEAKRKRSKKKHVKKEKFLHETIKPKPIKSASSAHGVLPLRKSIRTNVQRYFRAMSEGFITQFIATITDLVKARCMHFETCCSVLQEECTNTSHGNMVHKWKTVSERHRKVSGFGYINDVIGIYLKEDDEKDKQLVQVYLEKYVDPAKFKFKIEYRRRKVTLFSKIEQGSRINITADSGKGPKDYGTLGMFLHDNNGTYFFTTCAHVIKQDAIAYLPENNSKLGVSVLTCHPNSHQNESNQKWIDFSLVKVIPDKEITCTFGLKTTTESFIQGDIFRGDVSEILHRRVYKWGATEPYLQQGICKGFVNNGTYLILEIDTANFAKEGDSGSIICVGDDVARGMAAFVLVGGCPDDDLTYDVYKFADALEKIAEKIGREVTPCLCPCTKAIRIESRPLAGNGETMRRNDKVLLPRN